MSEKDILQIGQDISQIKGDIVAHKSDVRNLTTKISSELKLTAMKADVEQMGRLLVMWMAGSMTAISCIVFAVARHIK